MSERRQMNVAKLPAAPSNARRPNPIDIHVGSRLRMRRMLLGLSQEKLGDLLGLTFQQVQKYEKGTNRIGASRLFELARILSVPVQFFYEGLPVAEDGNEGEPSESTEKTSSNSKFIIDFVGSREGIELNRAFFRIADPKVRRSLIVLVKSLAPGADTEDDPSETGA